MTEQIFMSRESRLEGLEILMRHAGMYMFTYRPASDEMVVYDARLQELERIAGVLYDPHRRALVHPEDFWKLQEFLEGRLQGPIEFRIKKRRTVTTRRCPWMAAKRNKTASGSVLLKT